MHTLKYTASLQAAKFTNQSTLIWSKQSTENTTTLQEFTVTWQIVKMIVFHYPIQIFQKQQIRFRDFSQTFKDQLHFQELSRPLKLLNLSTFKDTGVP